MEAKKEIPLRCDACGQIVGSAKLVQPMELRPGQGNELSVEVEGTMKLEQHLLDCPVLASLIKGEIPVISIGGPVDGPVSANVFDVKNRKTVRQAIPAVDYVVKDPIDCAKVRHREHHAPHDWTFQPEDDSPRTVEAFCLGYPS